MPMDEQAMYARMFAEIVNMNFQRTDADNMLSRAIAFPQSDNNTVFN